MDRIYLNCWLHDQLPDPLACPLKEELLGSPLGHESEGEEEASCGVAARLRRAATPQEALFPPRSRSGVWASSRFRQGAIRPAPELGE